MGKGRPKKTIDVREDAVNIRVSKDQLAIYRRAAKENGYAYVATWARDVLNDAAKKSGKK